MNWNEMIQNVKTKEDFIEFMNILKKDFDDNPDQWQNTSIDMYLDGVNAWVQDYSQSDFCQIDFNQPNWSMIALLFYVDKIYE